ncbi:hypothetical protein [Rhizobium mesosinicum]|uniref:Uncharacterized protein n=1 Tax=Rhizobium mesosinicum TaxID=335017 RepID=A0ABS7H0I2_9HYPH|nr:hypothetical protein [Rhizobium mesosinicum]MBW9055745.1 hypothetical protein [Rhizobium mesosinicum]
MTGAKILDLSIDAKLLQLLEIGGGFASQGARAFLASADSAVFPLRNA